MVGLDILNLHSQQPSTICPFASETAVIILFILVGFFILSAEG